MELRTSLPVDICDRILCFKLHPVLLLYYGQWRALLYHERRRPSYLRIKAMFRSNASLYHLGAHFEYERKMVQARADFDAAQPPTGEPRWTNYLHTGDARRYAWEDSDIYPAPPSVPSGRDGVVRRTGCAFERQYESVLRDEDAREEWVSHWWSPLHNRPKIIIDLWSMLFYRYFPRDIQPLGWLARRFQFIANLNPYVRSCCSMTILFSNRIRNCAQKSSLPWLWSMLDDSERGANLFDVIMRVFASPYDTSSAVPKRFAAAGAGAAAAAAAAAAGARWEAIILPQVATWFKTMEVKQRYPRCAHVSLYILSWLARTQRENSAQSKTGAYVTSYTKQLVENEYWSPRHKLRAILIAKTLPHVVASLSCASGFDWIQIYTWWKNWFTTYDDTADTDADADADAAWLCFWNSMSDTLTDGAIPFKQFTSLAWFYLSTPAFRRWSRHHGLINTTTYVHDLIRNMYLRKTDDGGAFPERGWQPRLHERWWQWYDAARSERPLQSCLYATGAGYIEQCIRGAAPDSTLFTALAPKDCPNWWDWFAMLQEHPGWTPLRWFQSLLCTNDMYHAHTKKCIAKRMYDWITSTRSVEGMRWFSQHPWFLYCVDASLLGRWRCNGYRHLLRALRQRFDIGLHAQHISHEPTCAALRDVFVADNEHHYLRNVSRFFQKIEGVGETTRHCSRINACVGHSYAQNQMVQQRAHLLLRTPKEIQVYPWLWTEFACDDGMCDLLHRMLLDNRANLYFIGTPLYVIERCYEQHNWKVAKMLRDVFNCRPSARCLFADNHLCRHVPIVG